MIKVKQLHVTQKDIDKAIKETGVTNCPIVQALRRVTGDKAITMAFIDSERVFGKDFEKRNLARMVHFTHTYDGGRPVKPTVFK